MCPPCIALQKILIRYIGYTRLARMLHIARLSPPLALEALRTAIPESKSAKDPRAYAAFTELLHEIDPENEAAIPDVEWIERKQKENQRETERLEHELRGYKNNLIKESIRVSVVDHWRVADDLLRGYRWDRKTLLVTTWPCAI